MDVARNVVRNLLAVLLFSLASLAQATSPAPAQPADDDKPRINKQQAQELFRSVDDILQWVSKETGLPIKHPVKRELASRAQVQHFLEERQKDDEDAKRLARSELVLKKFGLIPRNFDLNKFLIQLLREQIVGFYDPKKQTVFLLDWTEPEAQRPVLAHELTHALQDQNFNLEKWQRAGMPTPEEERKAEQESLKSPEAERRNLQKEIAADELSSARQAVTEGQGMVTLFDYMLAPTGRTITTDPAIAEAMKQSMMASNDSPVFSRAPLTLKEALTFPYRYGVGFEQTMLKRGGKELAFRKAMESPPSTTREVMEPLRYVNHETVPEVPVFAVGNMLGADFVRFDVGAMGEFDVYLIADSWADQEQAARFAPAWRGGYYYAASAKPAGKHAPDPKDTAAVKLLYVSRWDSPETARRFADFYGKSLEKRYSKVTPALALEGDAPTWNTEEGPVQIATDDRLVIVTEGFEAAVAKRLRQSAQQAANEPAQKQPAKP